MQPVEEIQRVNERLVYWEGYDPSAKVDLSSHALLTSEGWVLVDPIPVREEALEELTGGAHIAAVILTNANHDRAAAFYNGRYKAPIFTHADAAVSLDVNVDRTLLGGEEVFGLKIVHLPGFAPGEIALYSKIQGGLFMFGDAVINLPQTGLALLPDKYCDAPKLARESAQKLLQFPFEIMTFAHGQPVTAGARKKLETLFL